MYGGLLNGNVPNRTLTSRVSYEMSCGNFSMLEHPHLVSHAEKRTLMYRLPEGPAMGYFTKIEFKLKAKEAPKPPEMSAILKRLGDSHYKNVRVGSSWGEATFTGEADSPQALSELIKALDAKIDKTTYYFAFDCRAKVTQAAIIKMLTWRTYRDVKLRMSECKFNSEHKITRAIGYAPSESAVDDLYEAIH